MLPTALSTALLSFFTPPSPDPQSTVLSLICQLHSGDHVNHDHNRRSSVNSRCLCLPPFGLTDAQAKLGLKCTLGLSSEELSQRLLLGKQTQSCFESASDMGEQEGHL